MKDKIKYILIFLIVLIASLVVFPLTLDEIWTYGFSYNIVRGSIPYNDFNMVITPFYPYFMSIFLLIYNNILTMYIVDALMYTVIFYLLEKMYKDSAYLIFIFMFFPVSIVMLNYNAALLFFLVLLVYLEKSKNKNKDIYIGIVLALSVLTKQSVGVFLLIPSVIFRKKIDLKKRVVAFIIPCFIFLIYLLLTNSLYNFLDLCLFGLFDFTENTHGFNFNIIIFLVFLFITIYLIRKHKEDMLGYYVLCFYSIFIPLFDIYHLSFCLIGLLMLIFEYYDINFIKKKMFFYLTLLLLIISYIKVQGIYINFKYPNDINHLEYRYLSKSNVTNIKKITKYVKNKKVIIYEGNSYLYRIVNDEKIDYFDLVNHGNWGYDGSKKVIRELKKKKDYIVLINLDDKERVMHGNHQLDKKGYSYIIKNGKKVGRIDQYTIYKLN